MASLYIMGRGIRPEKMQNIQLLILMEIPTWCSCIFEGVAKGFLPKGDETKEYRLKTFSYLARMSRTKSFLTFFQAWVRSRMLATLKILVRGKGWGCKTEEAQWLNFDPKRREGGTICSWTRRQRTIKDTQGRQQNKPLGLTRKKVLLDLWSQF